MNNTKRQPVTIADVARRAEVSVGTVSRVLNGYSNIIPENLERVRRAIKDLDYQKCHTAEMLGSRKTGSRVRTGNIGLVYVGMSPNWENHPFVTAHTFGAERACEENGYHVLVEFVEDGATLPRCCQEGKVDGVLIKASKYLPEFLSSLPSGFPVVGMEFDAVDSFIPQVMPDDRGAGRAVTEYLWKLGHRRIGFICNSIKHPSFFTRYQGYEAYLRGIQKFDPTLCVLRDVADRAVNTPESEPPDENEDLSRILSSPGERVTAIITPNDWVANGLYEAIAKAGLRIPDDISVIGFDNTPTLCQSMRPQLSSYGIPFGAVANRAAKMLMEKISNPSGDQDRTLHLVRGEIIERASVKSLQAIEV